MKKLLLLFFALTSILFASIGEITAIKGDANIIRDGKVNKIILGFKLEKHDEIKTLKNAKLQIIFNDETVISLGQNSDLKVDEYIFEKDNVHAKFSVGRGFFKSITGKIGHISPKNFKIKTTNATIGVRGTTIIGEVSPKIDIIACSQGRIVVSSAFGSVVVNQGERTAVAMAKAPTPAKKVNSIIMREFSSNIDLEVNDISNNDNKKLSISKVTNKLKPVNLKEEQQDAVKAEILDKNFQSLKDIQNIIGTQVPVYEGKVTEGSTNFGIIKDDENNRVELGFDLGSGDFSGRIQFNDELNKDYNINVDGTLKKDATFDFTPDRNKGFKGAGEGILSGEKFEQANGNFDFKEKDIVNGSINNIQGKFEAILK